MNTLLDAIMRYFGMPIPLKAPTGIIIHSAFQRDFLEINRMNADIFLDVMVPQYPSSIYLATSGSTGKPVGFMIFEDHGGGRVHILRIGAIARVNFQEVCHELLDIISNNTRIATYVDNAWPVAQQLCEFLTREGFASRGGTTAYRHYEKP